MIRMAYLLYLGEKVAAKAHNRYSLSWLEDWRKEEGGLGLGTNAQVGGV